MHIYMVFFLVVSFLVTGYTWGQTASKNDEPNTNQVKSYEPVALSVKPLTQAVKPAAVEAVEPVATPAVPIDVSVDATKRAAMRKGIKMMAEGDLEERRLKANDISRMVRLTQQVNERIRQKKAQAAAAQKTG